MTKYHIIKSIHELNLLIRACKKTKYACIDFETTGLRMFDASFVPTMLSVTFQAGSSVIIPLRHEGSPLSETWLKYLQKFGRQVIENPNITKLAWNWKYDNKVFKRYSIFSRGTIIDGMLAKYVLNEEKPHGLKPMVERYLPEFGGYEKANNFDELAWDKKPWDLLTEYGATDTDMTFRLCVFLEKKLIDTKLYTLYRNLIMPASKVLQCVEYRGLVLDRELNASLNIKYAQLIEDTNAKLRGIKRVKRYQSIVLKEKRDNYIQVLQDEIDELKTLTGKERSIKSREDKIINILAGNLVTKKDQELISIINFGSQKQMVELLYTHPKGLELPIIAYTKNKLKQDTENPSTAEETLLKLKEFDKHGFIDTLLELRGYEHIYSTFIKGYSELIQEDGRVHPSFNIHGCISKDEVLIGKNKNFTLSEIIPEGLVENEPLCINGPEVLTHNGHFKKVTHVIYKGNIPYVSIEDDMGNFLRCTLSHKLLTPDGWKTVRSILKHNQRVIKWDTSYLELPSYSEPLRNIAEEIKPIQGWPGYLISNYGVVFSTKIKGGKGKTSKEVHEMSTRTSKRGLPRVGLRNNSGKKYMKSISILVAENFISKIPDGYIVDHINNNPSDNYVGNLQYITKSDNTKKASTQTRNDFTRGSKNGSSILNILEVGKILSGEKTLKCTNNSKNRIIRSKSWSHISLSSIKVISKGVTHIYDMTVEGDHSYITKSGFISLNTVTGRLSSSDPNAQQIPKKEVNPDVKLQFTTPPGQLFLSYDYSQAELRVMAHLSGDETLLEAFRLGRDPHLSIACKKYGEDYDKILPIYQDETHSRYKEWKVKRKQAKQIVFGCIYGIEAKKLSEQLSDIKMGILVTKEEAQKFLDEFFQDSPKIRLFMDNQGKKMEKNGYIKTLFGRKRRCPKIYSENYGEYLEAKRQSVNTPCQSVGSDMALFASILIHHEMKKGNLPYIPEVSTVHDSIYQYCIPEFINPWTIYQFYLICRNPDTKKYFNFKISDVDMAMDFSVGRNMAEELPYTPGYDYARMLEPDFSLDDYYKLHNSTKHIAIEDYPKEFPQYFSDEFLKAFKQRWTKRFNTLQLG